METLRLSRDAARRFLVARHMLSPARALPARASSVLTVVERLGSLQFDPLEAPGARNHDLVLHARIRDYRRAWLDRWLYGPPAERRLFEAWNKGLSILPVDELPYHRTIWDVAVERYAGFLDTHAAVAARVLDEITRRGPLATRDFGRGEVIDWWWGRTALNRAVIDVLFLCGHLGIARRDGNARTYDLLERVLPAAAAAGRADPAPARRHRLLSRVRGVGLLGAGGSAEVLANIGTAAERRALFAELIDDGTLVPVDIEGVRGTRAMLATETPHLRSRRGSSVAFLAPLDPLLWDRRLVKELWGFDYTWEVYTPAAKRRFGYYALPVLWGDRIIGRIEPRFERRGRALAIAGLWLEPGVDVDESGLATAFAAALADYVRFVGAERVTWSPGLRGRAGALARSVRKRAPRIDRRS